MAELRIYARWFSHNAIKKRLRVRRASEQPLLSHAATEILRDWSVLKPLSVSSIDELIAALETFQEHAPMLTITLPAPPTPGIKAKLVDWCRKNIATDTLVSFDFNAALLGGLVVKTDSHIFDWSFRRQILDNRAKIPEVLRNV
jgi:hypothetical protein